MDGGAPRGMTIRAKLWIGLALPIHDGRDVLQQVGQVVFAALAPTQPEAIQTHAPALHLVHSFADGSAISVQLPFG